MTNSQKIDQPTAKVVLKEVYAGVQKAYSENITLLDKSLLALSAGLLGLSFAFITDLVDLKSATIIPLLVFSWSLFGASILAVLFGLRYATKLGTLQEKLDAGKQFTGLGEYASKGQDPKSAKERWDICEANTEKLNKLSFWTIVLALISLVAFISINILTT